MLSIANIESHKLNKEQMHELIHLISHQDASDPDSVSPPPHKQSSGKNVATKKHSKSNASKFEHGHGHANAHAGADKKPPAHVPRESAAKAFHILSDDEIDDSAKGFLKCPCCPRRSKRNGPDEQTVLLWRDKYCKTFEDFNSHLVTCTKNARLSFPSFNDIKHELSYENDPTALGLSSFGGLMWILTYGIQHLADPTQKAQNLSTELASIRATYQEIGSTAQKFVIIAEKYGTRMGEIHSVVMDVVTRVSRKYKFTKDPLYLRPAYKPRPLHLRKRVGYEPPPAAGGSGSGPESASDEEFHVNWSPLTIVVQYPQSKDWEIFTTLTLEQRLSVYKMFVKYALHKLEGWIQKFTDAVNYTSASSNAIAKAGGSSSSSEVSKEKPGKDEWKNRSLLFEISIAMQNFIKSGSSTKNPPHTSTKENPLTEKRDGHDHAAHAGHEQPDHRDVEQLQLLVEDFWFTMDQMYELSVEIERLVQATRDAVRMCYVYATHFYQWKLASYDTFDQKTKTKEHKLNQKQMKAALAKILGQRRFSDAAMFISLADFTSSIYQRVAQNHDYSTGGYSLKLNSWVDEDTETWGLLGDAK